MSCHWDFADLFCGAGGTTTGAEATGAAKCVMAVNHWDCAINTHSKNHPRALHRQRRVQDVSPTECPRIKGLFASPECTFFSRARSGRPTSDQQRSGAWEIMPWLECHRPQYLIVENVREFAEWGPCDAKGNPLKSKRGQMFSAWAEAIRACGYRVEHHVLNAADFGAATSRSRLFVIARKGQRNPVFPEPTHGKEKARSLPGMGREPWRAVADVIDWSLPCPSIFTRSRPLKDKTLARIEAGLRRFVGPYVTGVMPTIVAARENHGVVVPFQLKVAGSSPGLMRSISEPVRTLIATNPTEALCVPFISTVNHGDSSDLRGRSASMSDPLGTMTAKNGRAVVVPFLSQYYGTATGSGVTAPIPTIVTKDRHSLVTATIDPCCFDWPAPQSPAMESLQRTMRELNVADIGFRMLQNNELSAAQGFPGDYQFTGTKSDITKQIGNSVSPPVAEAITRTILGL